MINDITILQNSLTLPKDNTNVSTVYLKVGNSIYDASLKKETNEKIENFVNDRYEAYKAKKYDQVLEMINKDIQAPKNADKEAIARSIVEHSFNAGIEPMIIASIAQHETHFTQESSLGSGNGIMQLTSISVKDMFLRPKLYGESIKPILDKYKTPENLLKAIRKDADLNIKLGIMIFKEKLRVAKGDVFKALKLYNATDNQENYAKEISKYLAIALQESPHNINYEV